MLVFFKNFAPTEVISADKALLKLLSGRVAHIYTHAEYVPWCMDHCGKNPFDFPSEIKKVQLTVLSKYLAVGKDDNCLVVRRTDGHPRTISYDLRDVSERVSSFECFYISRDNLVVFCKCSSWYPRQYSQSWFAFDVILETFNDITDMMIKHRNSFLIGRTCYDTYLDTFVDDSILLSKYITITHINHVLEYKSICYTKKINVKQFSCKFWNINNHVYGLFQAKNQCFIRIYTDTMMDLFRLSFEYDENLPDFDQCVVDEENVIFYQFYGNGAIILTK